ncbi:hypothetical protein PF049_04850 [Erythrobacteraceae bacterium WH01K]|nr:hypothetical protein PF049_04850 [Erythrobacteraceae bacterium WH01K]
MKNLILAATGMALISTMPAEAQAGPFDKLKKAARSVEQTARDAKRVKDAVEDAERTKGRSILSGIAGSAASSSGGGCFSSHSGSSSASACTAKGKGHGGRAGPAPAKYTAMTKCSTLELTNVMMGRLGEYTYQEGISTQKRTGLIDREPAAVSDGCILPSMGTYDSIYFEVDEQQYKAMGNSDDWDMQCLDSLTGEPWDQITLEPAMNSVKGRNMLLHCGNSEGIAECATGSNRDRQTAYQKKLKQRGKTAISFTMHDYHQESGRDYYCQFYNRKTGTSLVGFHWRLSAGRT